MGWVTDKSHIVTYGSQMSYILDLRWVTDKLRTPDTWVTNGSHVSHTMVILSNATFLIFSKLISPCPVTLASALAFFWTSAEIWFQNLPASQSLFLGSSLHSFATLELYFSKMNLLGPPPSPGATKRGILKRNTFGLTKFGILNFIYSILGCFVFSGFYELYTVFFSFSPPFFFVSS